MTAATIVVFWPAAFFIKGDGATAAELGRLKGEFEALEKAAIEQRCSLQFRQRSSGDAGDAVTGRRGPAFQSSNP
jgi:hypothetical protein